MLFCRANWVKLNGQKYKNSCVMMTEVEDESPVFCQIKQISIVDTKILLEVTKFITVQFCMHFHAYEIKETSECCIIDIDDLKYPYTEVLRCCDSKLLVVVRYHISGILA